MTTLPLKDLHRRLVAGELTATALAQAALAAGDKFASTRMFLHRDEKSVHACAEALDHQPDLVRPLAGLPVSVKDLFDVANAPTTCGSSFYATTRAVPTDDSGYVARWRHAGVNFVGKTNLNEFAYGITGENRWFGDCTVPGFPDRLTGGSSSGAAASVAAGAACLALGTDTGGSLRVPAALCGLVSFRQSLGFAEWAGAFPLAHSFDTAGWLQRYLADLSFVAHALHPEVAEVKLHAPPRIAVLTGKWLQNIDEDVQSATVEMADCLKDFGCLVEETEAVGWEGAPDIFVPIQAHEAAKIHGPFLARFADQYDPAVLARLRIGAGVSEAQYAALKREQQRFFTERIAPLFTRFDFLVAPACATRRLIAGVDHGATRPRLLRLTTPASLGGLPVLTVPWRRSFQTGIGFQLLASVGGDSTLWALADWLVLRGLGNA